MLNTVLSLEEKVQFRLKFSLIQFSQVIVETLYYLFIGMSYFSFF